MNRAKTWLCVAALAAAVGACVSMSEQRKCAVDLSSPETTVVSFTKAAALGDIESALNCCLPGSYDYDDIKNALTASPSAPSYAFKQMLESVDRDAPIQIVSVEKNGDKATVIWRITFKRDVRMAEGGGHTFKAGSTFDLDGTLRKSEDRWLIEGI